MNTRNYRYLVLFEDTKNIILEKKTGSSTNGAESNGFQHGGKLNWINIPQYTQSSASNTSKIST